MATVSHLRASPVKGLNQTERDALTLVPGGIDEDRRFVIVEDGRALYGANLAEIAGTTRQWDAAAGALTIMFADGETASGTVATTGERRRGERRTPGGKVPGEVVDGPVGGGPVGAHRQAS